MTFPRRRPLFFPFLVLLLLLPGTVHAVRADDSTNVPTVTPTAVIPFLTVSPKMDGVIEPGEWPTLHVGRFVSQNGDLLERRPGEFWVGCDRKTLYVAVRSGVHPTLGAVAKFTPKGNADQDVVMDDSLEIWVDNSPGQGTGQYFQIMVNPNGAIYDARFSHHDKIAEKFWRVSMSQGHTVKDGVWTAEVAISLASLGITDPTQPLGVRVCRDYKNPWDQARWAPRVRSFDAPETMPQVRFADAAPAVEELPVQDADGVTVGVSLLNPTSAPLPLHVRLGYNAQDQPRYYQNTDVTLAPGQRQEIVYKKPFFTPDDYPALGEALVTDAAGETVYHRDFKWHTRLIGTPDWDAAATPNPAEATKLDIAYYPSYHLLRWRGNVAALAGKESVQRMRLVVRDKATGKVVAQQGVGVGKDFAAIGQLALPTLATGTYEAALYLERIKKLPDHPLAPTLIKPNSGGTGEEPRVATSPLTPPELGAGGRSSEPARVAEFTHATFAWENNKLGTEDVVIPPFTPLTVKGRVVSAILRQHVMADNGLWAQVHALGRDILAGPMRLEVRQGGLFQPVTAKLRFQSAKPTQVVAVSAWSGGDLRGRTTSEFDYDGCLKVTLDLPPTKTPVEALDLVIPLKNDAVPLMHACGEGLRSNYGGYVPKGQGVVWTSAQASRDGLLGTFLPYLWIGGEERGLVWFASNDRDWVPDPSDKLPALSLERKGETLTLRVRLIAHATKLDRPRHIVFGLQATPVKPMPTDPDWRLRGEVAGGQFIVHVLGMSMYWGADLYGNVPRGGDYTVDEKLAQAEKQGQRDNAFFDAYLAKNPDIKAEVNSASNPGHADAMIPYTNLRGEVTSIPEWPVYQDEWRRMDFPGHSPGPVPGSIDFSLTPVQSRQDYLLYAYRQLLLHGFDGIYWDNICIYDNDSPVTGGGYVRPDGLFQPDTDIWLLRQLTKRTATMFYEMGRRNLTMPHMTNAYLIPVFSWSTMNLDWEMHYGGTDFQDRFTRDYIRAASLGRQGGNMPIVLSGITEVSDPQKRAWVERTRTAVCIPHELAVWEADPFFAKVRAYLYSLGYGTPACRVVHYWDENPALSVGGIDAAWIAFENKDTVAVMVTDYGGGGDAKLTLDTHRLGLPSDFTASNWENPSETWTANGGVLTVPNIAKHDFRLLVIKKG